MAYGCDGREFLEGPVCVVQKTQNPQKTKRNALSLFFFVWPEQLSCVRSPCAMCECAVFSSNLYKARKITKPRLLPTITR